LPTKKKLPRLTAEQEALLAIVRDEWITIGLDTRPADRPAAERAIGEMYRCAGLAPPDRIVWCGSPAGMALTRAVVLNLEASVWSVWDSVGDSIGASVRASVGTSVRASVGTSVGDSVRDSVWDSVRDSVWDSVGASVGASVRASVWDSVRDSVGASVGDSVRDSVGASVWDSVGASVWDSVGDSVGDSVRDSVGASVWDSVRDSVYGQHDANWLSFFEFFHRIGLDQQTRKLAGLWQLARAAGWAIPHQRICWVAERPELLALEPMPARGPFANRLHCEDGPAVRYPDGWPIYAWHGVRVPENIIIRPVSAITTSGVVAERNAEVARVLLERMGVERFASEADGGRIIHHDIDGQGNARRLVSIPMPNMPDREARVVVVECPSTHHQYVLGVPPRIATCQAAVAWTFGVDAVESAEDLVLMKEQ